MTDLQKFCDELRARISIVDVVGSRVKLVRKGREYQACCPFHNEKTPSFTVNEAKGFYHCFGCGAHGDIIKFEMEANNLPFIEAVEKLAAKAGMQLPKLSHEHKEEAEKKASLYDIMELAVKFYEKNLRLRDGQRALEYLYNRGFNDEIIAKFRLGYAPGNNGLLALLRSKGISEADMSDLGLVSLAEKNTSKRTFDFFRDRVIIPIFDKRGRPIAFGGRIMGDGQPKYLNSPETPIFNKRRVLYNMNNARDKAYAARNLIVCEGYMDVIALDKYGFGYAVAPLGTALTEDQIEEAWKVCEEPVLCFDGDNAGIRAAIRSVDRGLPILKPGYSLRYAFLPDKMDPDEFLKSKGSDEFLKILNETMPLKDLLWRKNVEGRVFDTPEQKALIEKNVREEVAKIQNETIRGYYLQEMQDKIYNELGRGSRKNRFVSGFRKNEAHGEVRPVVKPKTNINDNVSRFVVSGLLFYPALIGEYEERLASLEIRNADMRKLLDCMLEAFQENDRLDFAAMYSLLKDKGLGKEMSQLWEVAMFKQQNPEIYKIREDIDTKIIEEQLLQLENEIKECLSQIEASESFPEELYKRYESLKSEKEALLNTQPLN